MKKYIILFSFVSLSLSVFSQSSAENYIKVETMLDEKGCNRITSIQYFDGLGKSVQSVESGINQDPNQTNYLITEYDAMGRVDKKWLPIAGRSLGFVSSKESEATDSKAYSQTQYDAIDRPIFISTPGSDMRGRGKKIEYLTNWNTRGKNKVKKYVLTEGRSPVLGQNGYYETGELFSEKTTDEDGKTIEIFKNLMGDIILERRADSNDTYFVYNSLHQLRFVLSPQYQQSAQKAIYSYEYLYDKKGNIIKRILPQCEAIQYWYDSANRLIFMQDANLRERKKYRFYLYDNIGRVVVQGLSSIAKTIADVVSGTPMASYSSISEGVGKSGYILDIPDLIENKPIIEVVNYYDNYNFLGDRNKSKFSFPPSPSTSTNVTGYQTGSIVCASNGEYLYDVFYYNNKGLLIAKNRRGLDDYIEKSSIAYSFTNNPIKETYSVEKNGRHYIVSQTTHYYDNNSNKVSKTNLDLYSSIYHKSMDISVNEYDAYGRLKTVKRNFDNGNIDYSYDLRGWLTKINTDFFKEEIFYTDNDLNKACYNGNISAIRWKDTGYRPYANHDMKYRGYKYTYDNINRLQSGIYGENDDLTANPNRYDELIGGYDSNGNITSLKRRGLKNDKVYDTIDDLKIKYNGNQIQTIRDDAMGLYYENAMDFVENSYHCANKYNTNGSLVQDGARGIALIDYDQWNYPCRIQFTNGNVIKYVYSAAGEKLRTIHYVAHSSIDVPLGTRRILSSSDILSKDSSDYYGSFIMENGKPLSYQFEGGYCSFKDNATFYFYNQDHLGNNRTVINSTTGKAEQTINYYPYGAPYCDSTSVNPGFQKFKYNGKELDMMSGLNSYDYGARQYYSVVPAWDRIDTFAEKYYNVSPYVYCAGNPIGATDPNGKELELKGSRNQQKYLLKQLQRLTNDNLFLDYKTGKVTIGKKPRWDNRNKKLISGTGLIRSIINSDKILSVELNNNGFKKTHEVNRRDDANGKGTDAKIYYDPSRVVNVLTQNLKTGKTQMESLPVFIGLGHELVHGERSLYGRQANDGDENDEDVEAVGTYQFVGLNGKLYEESESLEEIETTGLNSTRKPDDKTTWGASKFSENLLRREHYLNIRIKYR